MIQFHFLRTILLATLIVAAAQTSTFAQTFTEPLELVNETGQTIMSLYFVPVQKKSWGNDLVGSGVMNQGDRRAIHYDSAFMHYKIKIEFADGTIVTNKDIDLFDAWRLDIRRDGTCEKNARG